jgi:K+-sensing histidine kinase KdpD
VVEQLRRSIPRWLLPAGAGLVLVTTTALLLNQTVPSVTAAGWLYLLLVLVIALRYGRDGGVATALLAGLLLYILVVEPRYHWRFNDPRDLIRLALSVSGMVAAVLAVDRANRGRLSAERRLAAAAAREAAEQQLAYLAVDNARLYLQAQQGIRARDELLASTSHELRTPLTHIKGFVSTLRQTDVEWDASTRSELLADVERETDRLAGLIGDLLDMSRIESGGIDRADYTPARPSDIIRGGLDRVRGLIDIHEITVETADCLPMIQVDVAQVERVIANLVENAVKYGASAGTTTVAATTVDSELELRVLDDGPGIPPEHLNQVFERFFRVPNDRRFSVPGAGLGLAICRGIVQAHGGRIWAENRATGGACFIVRLPVCQDTQQGRP